MVHGKPWSAWSDEELLLHYARQGAQEAFAELVQRYECELYGYLWKYFHNAQASEDAFQTVFLQVHLNRHEFDPTRRFRPWLYRIATTRAIDLLRRNRRWSAVQLGMACGSLDASADGRSAQEVVDQRTAETGQQLVLDEDRRRVQILVESLPARLKDVVVLVMLRAEPYQKAAEVLGIPVGTVKSRLHQAMRRLRRLAAAA